MQKFWGNFLNINMARVRQNSVRNATYFLRKRRNNKRRPSSHTQCHQTSNQQEAMQSLMDSFTNPTPNPISLLVNSFSTHNTTPTPDSYHFLLKTLFETSQFHHIPPLLHRIENAESFETPEHILIDLIAHYGSANRYQDALDVFSKIPRFRCVPTADSLNALLMVICRNREGLELVPQVLIRSRKMNIRIDPGTVRILINALCRFRKVGGAIGLLKCCVENELDVDMEACSMILSHLCSVGEEEEPNHGIDVLGFVGEMRDSGFCPGLVDYKNVIKYLVKKRRGRDALHVFNGMKDDGIKPDIVCYGMVLSGVIEDENYEKAEDLFDELLIFGLVPDINTYNVYIDGLCKQGRVDDAVKITMSMEELGCKGNEHTYRMLIVSLCNVGEVSRAKELLKKIGKSDIGLNLDL